MKAAFEATYHAVEERHWWFRGRRDYLLRLTKALALPRDAAILDVGCASGTLVEALARKGYERAIGIDLSESAVQQSKRRGLANVRLMDAAAPVFSDASVDLLIASDVLEHIENEREALTQWRRLLKPEGTLAIFVPAFQFLWSAHDDSNMHYRRYTRRALTSRLVEAGFEIMFSSYWNFMLFGPAAAYRLAERRLLKRRPANAGDLRVIPLINGLLFALLRLENQALLARLPLPIGMSVMALARRRTGGGGI